MRIIGRILLLFLLLALVAGVGFGVFLVRTTDGARWLAGKVLAREPRLTLHVQNGNLWSGMRLREMAWDDGTNRVELTVVDARWRVKWARRPQLHIRHLWAGGLHIQLPPSPEVAPPRDEIVLPELRLPVDIFVRSARLDDIAWSLDGDTQRIASVSVDADWVDDVLTIHRVSLDHEFGKIEGEGFVRPQGGYPIGFRLQARSETLLPPHLFELDVSVSNEVQRLKFSTKLSKGNRGIFASGIIKPLNPQLPIEAQVSFLSLAWPLEGEPQVTVLGGSLELVAALDPQDWWVEADLESATLFLKDQFSLMTASGPFFGSAKDGWSTPGFRLAGKGNVANFSGSFKDIVDVQGTLELKNLRAIHPESSGKISGSWSVRGSLESPDIAVNLQGTSLVWGKSFSAESVQVVAEISALAMGESRIRIVSSNVWSSASEEVLTSVQLDATGTREKHNATLTAQGNRAALEATWDGTLDEETPAWSGSISQARIAAFGQDWILANSLAVQWSGAEEVVTIAPHRWKFGRAVLEADDPIVLGRMGAVNLRLKKFSLEEFRPWLPAEAQVRGTLSAAAELSWSPNAPPNGSATVEFHEAGLRWMELGEVLFDDFPPVDFSVEQLALHAKLDGTQLTARFDFAAPGMGSINAISSAVLLEDFTLEKMLARVELRAFQLEVVRPFLDDLHVLAGEVNASVQISGDWCDQQWQGNFSLTNGAVEPVAFPVALGDIHFAGELLGDRAEWAGGFRSGSGRGTLQGSARRVRNEWELGLNLSGECLELSYGALAVLQASPELRLNLSKKELALEGRIRIPSAQITIQQLPDSAVRVSGDAIVVEAAAPDVAVPPVPDALFGTQRVQVDIELGNSVTLGGYGISGRLAGTLQLRQEGIAAAQGFGELRIEDGRYRAFGQRLQIRRGQFIFSGPLDRPTLFVEAIREIPAHSVVAGLRVEGPPDALKTTLFSEPSFPEEDVLVFLVLGRPMERDESASTQALLTQAALAFGVARGENRVTAFAERLGIEQLQLDTKGDGDDTQVVVSGQVTSRLEVGYGLGVFEPASTVTLRYKLARNLFLEAMTGLESALDLLYSFRF